MTFYVGWFIGALEAETGCKETCWFCRWNRGWAAVLRFVFRQEKP